MAGAYYAREAVDAGWSRVGGRSEGFPSPAPWPHERVLVGERDRRLPSPMRGEVWDVEQPALGDYGRLRSPMRGERELPAEHSRLRSPLRAGSAEAAASSQWSRLEHLDRSVDASFNVRQAPSLPRDAGNAQRAFEHVQMELLLQSRRQDEMFECVARVEADLSRVARLAVENEGLHATERQQKHSAMANLTRKTEDALLTCESLRKGQEHLIHKIERLEAQHEDRERVSQETRSLQREVDSLQGTVREKLDTFGHALRRVDAMEQIFDENTKLRQEVAHLRRANERRDLEMAAVQGQIDALTKLVREQLREPPPEPAQVVPG